MRLMWDIVATNGDDASNRVAYRILHPMARMLASPPGQHAPVQSLAPPKSRLEMSRDERCRAARQRELLRVSTSGCSRQAAE